jgi:hypothetical protein
MIAVRIAAFLAGAAVVAWVGWSAIRIVVVPRGEQVRLGRFVFLVMREIFEFAGRRAKSYESYDRIMARYAPSTLLMLPLVWALGVFLAFIPMYWALGTSWREALIASGSSYTTLGFDRPTPLAAQTLCFTEALIGLGLVALLISYLPALYAAFARREAEVVKLETRAGSPPHAETFLIRIHRIRGLEYFASAWDDWEQWFVELEESHTSQPAIAFFRSPRPNSSWITAAGAVMDTAAITLSCLELEQNPQAQVTIRSGFLALRAIAMFFHLPCDPDPAPDAPISITRTEFDVLMATLVEAGLPVKADLDEAWRNYAGWRVNYDEPLLRLCALVSAPPAPWSSDRIGYLGEVRAVRLGRPSPGTGGGPDAGASLEGD